MKYSVVLCMLILLAFGCNRTDVRTTLLNEQKILKDSANNLNERIGGYMEKGINDSAEVNRKQLVMVHARLTAIQLSIDRLDKLKK